MTIDEAKALLGTCKRETLHDAAFGDSEVYWMRGDTELASGYFSETTREVSVTTDAGQFVFTGDEADALRGCGARGRVERNDAAGRPA